MQKEDRTSKMWHEELRDAHVHKQPGTERCSSNGTKTKSMHSGTSAVCVRVIWMYHTFRIKRITHSVNIIISLLLLAVVRWCLAAVLPLVSFCHSPLSLALAFIKSQSPHSKICRATFSLYAFIRERFLFFHFIAFSASREDKSRFWLLKTCVALVAYYQLALRR